MSENLNFSFNLKIRFIALLKTDNLKLEHYNFIVSSIDLIGF